ncbi:MAG: 4-alpha-glucanotransferase, partial [Bacilli bacterium]|nr:4-alpha-glucanotransferase [Bacilli bacterium]
MRQSGVLMPISALPNRFGCGDFGKKAREFVDILEKGGFKIWQILPLNPLGYGHSPYQPFSSFAIEELYVDLDALHARGLIGRVKSFKGDGKKVYFEEIRDYKARYLRLAYLHEMRKSPRCLSKFKKEHPWVESWSLFMLNKRRNNLQSWTLWSKKQQEMIKHPKKLTKKEKAMAEYEIWLQKTLYEQWKQLKKYANEKGIRIVGDVPFYVGFDSCDVWANQKTFLLDPRTHEPTWIAGVPPDYFSATGQRWGNPIYNW